MRQTASKRMIVTLTLAALVGAAWPLAAGEGPVLDASALVTVAEHGLPLWDATDGALVRDVLVEIVNHDENAPVVLVTIRALELELATVQPLPPAPWVGSWTRDTAQFLGTTGLSNSASFLVRILGTAPAGTQFAVDIQSALPSLGASLMLPAIATPTRGAHACQIVVETGVGGHAAYAPFATLSDSTPTFARAYVAVYDLDYGEYLDPQVVVGQVRAIAIDGADAVPVVGDETRAIALAPGGALPLASGILAPTLTPGIPEGVPTAVATLWDGPGAARAWFAQRPGSFRIVADAAAEGAGCEGQPYDMIRSVSPLQSPVGFSTATPLVIVPPETDSDADGYVNVNELRGNSNPLVTASTPYADDDGDGVMNSRDPLPLVATT